MSICLYDGKLIKDGEEIGDKRQCSSNCKKRGYDKMLQGEEIDRSNCFSRDIKIDRHASDSDKITWEDRFYIFISQI